MENTQRYNYLFLLLLMLCQLLLKIDQSGPPKKTPENSDLNCETFSSGLSSDILEQIA